MEYSIENVNELDEEVQEMFEEILDTVKCKKRTWSKPWYVEEAKQGQVSWMAIEHGRYSTTYLIYCSRVLGL